MKPAEKIELVRGDITQIKADAIVNAANMTLLGGDGVDGAIQHAAGPELLEECRSLSGCRPGEAKLTRAYRLPAKFVIHTVGPFWDGGRRGEAEVLANCYRNSLQLAVAHGLTTIAFPAISCGAFRYPIEQAAQVAMETTWAFLREDEQLAKVIFVLWNDTIHAVYAQAFANEAGDDEAPCSRERREFKTDASVSAGSGEALLSYPTTIAEP